MASSKIPESLHGKLCDLYGEIDHATKKRRGYRELSAWLLAEHQIEASREAVRYVVDPLRTERAELRREVLREKIAKTLAPQLETLDALMKMVADLRSGRKVAAGTKLKLLDEYRKAVDTKLKFADVGERREVSGEVDVTSGGASLRFYLPRETSVDDDTAPDAGTDKAG